MCLLASLHALLSTIFDAVDTGFRVWTSGLEARGEIVGAGEAGVPPRGMKYQLTALASQVVSPSRTTQRYV